MPPADYTPPIDYTPPAPLARHYDDRRYRLLLDEAVRLLSTRFELAFVAQGMAYVKDAGKGSAVNLVPLLESAAGIRDEGKLLDHVHAYVSRFLYALEAGERAPAKPYKDAKRKLAARIYPEANRASLAEMVTRDDLPGTVTMLALDDEGAFTSVTPEALEAWGVSADEAFRQANANAARRRVEVKTARPQTPSGRFPIHYIAEENHASSYALTLLMHDRKYAGEYGALVSVPSRALVLVTPLGPDSLGDVVPAFAATTGGLTRAEYERHDRPVSAGVYWLRPRGGWEAVAVTREGGRVWAEEPEGLRALRAG